MKLVILDTAYRDAIRQRLADRLAETAQRATEARIKQEAVDRHNALLRRALDLDMTLEPDTLRPGYFLTRSNEHRRCEVNLTSTTSCTCSQFAIFYRCACQALVIDHVTFETALSMRSHAA